ncbi:MULTISPECIES: hypothetical protein [unclassified Microcoleus]
MQNFLKISPGRMVSQKPGFLREYLVAATDSLKNPVSLALMRKS